VKVKNLKQIQMETEEGKAKAREKETKKNKVGNYA
jgi:hypothetical protein